MKKRIKFTSSASRNIAFRLDQETSEVLGERAARHRIGTNQLSRHYLIEALHRDEKEISIGDGLNLLKEDIEGIRRDFILIAEALLIGAGKATPEEAKQWVTENLIQD